MADSTYLSPYNRNPAVTAGWRLPASVTVADVTLREGEQGSEASFTLEEKIGLALRLDQIGVRQIEVGWPGKSALDRDALRLLRQKGMKAKTQALVQIYQPDWKWQVDATLDSGPDIIGLLHPTSELRLKWTDKLTHQEVIDRCLEAIAYTRNRGAIVALTPTDVTRTDLDFLKQLVTAAVEAGAARINLPDTVGVIMPGAFGYLVRQVVETVPVPVHVHCHNDFGLALANVLAAVEAGASIVDAAVNGLGERAGNPSLDEVAAALELFYGLDTGINLSELYALSREVEALSGVAIPLLKPLLGDNAFAHKLDVHLRGVLTFAPLFEGISPALVGNRRRIPVSRHAGPFVIQVRLQELGFAPGEGQVNQVLAKVREVVAKRKASLTDEEFQAIARSVMG
jgi:isopropylmalate/homocitrate/citramalate synthase